MVAAKLGSKNLDHIKYIRSPSN